MADQKITELPIKGVSGINLADYLLGIDAAEGYQMLISDLAKKIIEQYAGSSLAGTAQPIKDALDTVAENASGNLATIESGTTASKAYVAGDRLVLGGLLYKVTSAITQGGTITVDSNVVLDALADDMVAVEGEIGDTSISEIGNGTITGALRSLADKTTFSAQKITNFYDSRCENIATGEETFIFKYGNIYMAVICVKIKKTLTSAQTSIITLPSGIDAPVSYQPWGIIYNRTTGKLYQTNVSGAGNINIINRGELNIGDNLLGQIIWVA